MPELTALILGYGDDNEDWYTRLQETIWRQDFPAMDDNEAIDLYDMFIKHGILPRAGGWLDQPAWVKPVFRMIELIKMQQEAPVEKTDRETFKADWQEKLG